MDIEFYSNFTDIDENAVILAKMLSLDIKEVPPEISSDKLYLLYTPNGLSLNLGNMCMRADYTSMIPRFHQHNLNSELLVKAAKIRNLDHIPTVIDATAGLGEDSLLLAAAGFKVHMYEYNEIIYSLLYDAINRAKRNPELTDIVKMIEITNGNSVDALQKLSFTPDVIYLDPMFPTREKSSLIKKKFQILQKLELPCDNENELLESAIASGARKIIIKRPLKGKQLGNITPSYSYKGKSIRYDCIVTNKKGG